MTLIHSLAFYLHILAGSMALLLVWVPMTVKKGNLEHKKFGRYYHTVMMIVAASGATMATLVIFDPLLIHGEHLSDPSNADIYVDKMRTFYSLLLYLSLLVYVGLTHGELSLQCKTERLLLNRWQRLVPNGILMLSSVPLFISGWVNEITLVMIFPFLGIATAYGNIRFSRAKQVSQSEWLRQHISAYIGTAIGAYTAFFAFGGRTLLSDIGQWQLMFWILPGVIGAFVIRHFSTKYAPLAVSK